MAETTEFVSRIKVRDLISAFENKSSSDIIEFSRPRAKSVGNILAKNVVVQLIEFNSLDDIENALRKIETNLNFYEVYNKAKHVAFQEQLFNILTSIVNIENEAEDATAKRKRLISKTQTLVSFLNQKLPSNVSTAKTTDASQYKYVPYASYIKENGTTDAQSRNAVDNAKHKTAPHSESTKSTNISELSEAQFVSVKKLKENFLPKGESPSKAKAEVKNEDSVKLGKSVITNGFKQDQPKVEKPTDEAPLDERQQIQNVSVSKLRNMFEKKSEETPKGLEVVTDVRSETGKSPLGRSVSSVGFPYTERNLGNLRLQRSVSGSYMNYSGLLNRIDINRTNSVKEINNVGKGSVDNVEDSGTESDTTDDNEKRDDFDKYSVNSSTASLDYLEEKSIHTVQERIAAFESVEEHDVNYSTAKSEDVSRTENSASVADAEEIDENPSTTASDTKRDETSKESFAKNADGVPAKSGNENVDDVKGIQEIYANYSTASLDDVNRDTKSADKINVATIEGVEEIEVNYSTAERQNGLGNEQTASLKGVETSDVTYSNATSDSDDGKITTVDEEINKIDVDPALANEDIVLNPEDIKNADDEFEKLLESSEAEKIIT